MSYRVSIVGAGWSSCLKKTCAVGPLRTCDGKDRRDSYRLWARTQGLPSYQQLADAGLSAAGVILKFVFIVAVFLGCISTRIIKSFGAVEECRSPEQTLCWQDFPGSRAWGWDSINASLHPFTLLWPLCCWFTNCKGLWLNWILQNHITEKGLEPSGSFQG